MIERLSIVNADGNKLELYELRNNNGVSVKITNYGATITSIKAPDRNNDLQEVVLGFDDPETYLESHPFFGSTVGRYANRIAGGKFVLDDVEYSLDRNEGDNHLHGGYRGFDKVFWKGSISGGRLVMHHISPDGDQGYPGELDVNVYFGLDDNGRLDIEYNAVSSKDTIINLTNHSYFNLSGGSRDILGHELRIYAERYTPVDGDSIPTGDVAPVEGTPLDFTKMTAIGERIDDSHEQLLNTGGYDHNYVLDKKGICAEVYDPSSGRSLKVFTDKPGVQLYTGNGLDGITGHGGIRYTRNFGLCLETQFYPDSPNKEGFSDCILKEGDIYSYKTTYAFGVEGS